MSSASRPARALLLVPVMLGAALLQPPRFEPVQPELFAAGGSFVNAWADVDGDGDLDLFVGFNGEPNRLYRNDAGTFTDIARDLGIADARATRAGAWGDFDGDGDPDLLLGFTAGEGGVLRLYRNDGGRFTDVTAQHRLVVDSGAVRQPAWIDFDGDGDVDLFVAFRDRPNMLFRNDGGTFTEIASSIGLADARRSVGAVWFDYEQDGDLDLYVANMDGDANGLYRNDRGQFSDVAVAAGVAWGGRAPDDPANGTVRPCVEDVNADGVLDLFMANYGPNGLFLGRGDGTFEDVSEAWGIAIDARYDACAFGDFDNDGRLDLYVNGTVTGGVSYRDHLFRSTGSAFEDVTPPELLELQADHGVQWADFDGDGALDIALTGARPDGMHSLLRNTLQGEAASRSLQVMVLDGNGSPTRAGAEVRLYAAGSDRLLGTRIVDTGSGYDSQSVGPVHFGLASFAPVDVEVIFPSRGQRVRVRQPGVDPRGYEGRALIVRVADDAGSASQQPGYRQTQTDDYTRYEMLEPGSASFRIVYDVSATAAGAGHYFNSIRAGAEEEVHGVTDLHTGKPLEWRVVEGAEARRLGMLNASATGRYIAVSLARPVPDAGQARVRIDKTYRDTASYRVDGDRLTFERSLGIDRNAIVLPAGYEIVAVNQPSQVAQEADGRLRISFMNAGAAAVPLRVEARRLAGGPAPRPRAGASYSGPTTALARPAAARTDYVFGERAFEDRDITYFLQQPETHSFRLYHDYTETRPGMDRYLNVVRAGSKASDPQAMILDTGEQLRVETLRGAEITARGIDIGGSVEAGTEVVVIWFDPVAPGGSVRLRIEETYTDPGRYTVSGDELVWDRGFGRPRNTVVLPEGWYLTANAVPATITEMADGRIRLRYINDRPGDIEVYVRARRRQ